MTEPCDPKWSPPGGWNLDTLHFHLVTIMNEREKRLDERFRAQERTSKLLAEDRTLADRVEIMAKTISGINDRLIPVESRAGYVNITMIISGIAAVVGVAALLLHPLLH